EVVGEEIDERAGGRFYGIAVGIGSVRLDGSQVPGGKNADLGPVRKLSNRLVIESDIDLQPNFPPYMVAVIDIEPIRERFSAVAPFLDERGRRLVAAAEAFAAGYGGIAAVAMATGVAPSTIGRGLKELAQDEPPASARAGAPPRIRRPGAGRQRT